MKKTAKDYISAFRRGETFHRPVAGLIINHQADKIALHELEKELTTGSSEVREKIVELLTEIDFEASEKSTLQDQGIIKILSSAGLSKDDLGLTAAANVLRKKSTYEMLISYSDSYTKALAVSPDDDLLLLVAKAKPSHAKVVVEQIAILPEWHEKEAVKIARAALGNTVIEDQYITAAKQATNGESLAQSLKILGFIGTRRSLQAVASYLRTPLKITNEPHFERTVRKDALEALSYNYPDKHFLFPSNVQTQEDYAKAESFCTTSLGVIFNGPTPQLPPDRMFPSFQSK